MIEFDQIILIGDFCSIRKNI